MGPTKKLFPLFFYELNASIGQKFEAMFRMSCNHFKKFTIARKKEAGGEKMANFTHVHNHKKSFFG